MRNFAFLALLTCAPLAAQDIPIIDSDNFIHGLRAPSMEQATQLGAAFYEESHGALQRAWGKHDRYAKATIALFDVVTTGVVPLPLADPWVHEEYHRAVMSNRGISSFDEVYRFRFSPDSIAVSHVRDEELTRLKREHPADLVRLGEAGVEGEAMFVQQLEKDHFFRDSRTWNLAIYWLAKLDSQGYIASGTDTEDVDTTTKDWERDEGTSIRRRDFIGHDFTGWVYDLFRPDEPYEARGVHPSGVGIRRYRRVADLTEEEKRFLHKQGRLAAINFLDPNLVGLEGHGFNVTAAHYLTSFGYTIDVNGYLRNPAVFVTLHRYTNGARSFPGIDVELPGHAIEPRVAVWLQPRDQRFRTHDSTPGILVGAKVRRGRWFAEADAKTAGWVAGNVHLDRAIAVRGGISLHRQ